MSNDAVSSKDGPCHFSMHVRHSWSMLHSSSTMTPWDNMKAFYDSAGIGEQSNKRLKVSGNLGPCNMVSTDTELTDADDATVKNSFADAGIRLKGCTDQNLWEQKLSWDRKAAIKKWMSLVLTDPGSWTICRVHFKEGILSSMGGGLVETLRDCLGVKATSTIHARASPLVRFAAYAKEAGMPALPLNEQLVYRFLKESECAPTFPKSFIIAVSFAKHVLGLLSADSVLMSARIKGYAALHYCKKRKLLQRPPLTVEQIRFLERVVQDKHRTAYDRCASGFFLFCTFGRLRFSDAQSVSSMKLEIPDGSDRGYLECGAERCKTSTSLEKRTRLLPVVVPTLSFTLEGWIPEWLDARDKSGLREGANIPLLPSPKQGGGWSNIPMTCEVAGDWLRSLLKDVPGKDTKTRIGTHSCKAAVLSMASKYGMDPTARRFLGYHSQGRDQSMLTYSRDSMTWPVKLMEDMIEDVATGQFRPDEGRGGYFARQRNLEHSKECESTSSSGNSDDEEENNHSENERALEKVAGDWGKVCGDEAAAIFRHKSSRYLHVCADETGLHFRCGRKVTSTYDRCSSRPKFMHPVCSMCFK